MIVHITSTALDRFRAAWPCSGLHDVERIRVEYEDHGYRSSLLDVECIDENNRTIPIEIVDGDALAAIIADGYQLAVLEPDSESTYVYA